MQLRAENDPRYSRKFLIMGLVAFGFALWCLKDGLYSYPAVREQKFGEFKTDYKKLFSEKDQHSLSFEQFEIVATSEQREGWEKYVVLREIPTQPNIFVQYLMAAGSALAGLILISIPLRARGRWIAANDSGITSSWGESFQFDEVELINKRKWRSKGIAKVTYVTGGRRRNFVVDDYKFDRYPVDAILYTLERRIDPGRILNGPPEAEPEPDGPVAKALAAAK